MNYICNGYEFDMYLIQFQLNRCMLQSWFGEKAEITQRSSFFITEYVIDMNLICNGYEFDIYLIQFQWNRSMIKSGFGEKVENKQRSSFWYNRMCNWYGFDL